MQTNETADARQHLDLLLMERELAVSIGLDADPAYMADLEHQLATWKAAWIGACVTDLAISRAREGGRLHG